MNILLKSLTITLSLIAGLQAMDDHLPLEIEHKILTEAFILEKTKDTNFREIGINLSRVCKNWHTVIKKNAKEWVCEYFNIAEENKDVFWRFFKGKLIYKPNLDNDVGRIDLFISALPTPLEGTFPLSQCKILDEKGIEKGNAGQLLSISTGYRKGKKAENINKMEIWFPLRFLVEKELGTTAGHLKVIFPSEWPGSAEVGMLCTWGGVDNMDWYHYLTTENTVNLSKRNLYENWQKTWWRWEQGPALPWMEWRASLSSFVFELK
jgi:hypothetical protein